MPLHWGAALLIRMKQWLFYRVDHGLERIGMVHSKVCKNLSIKLNALIVKLTHQLGIGHSMQAGACVDTLDPQTPEIPFLGFTVAISILQTLFYSVFGNG